MFDLDILETSFARIVLGAAVIEDIFLYVVLAIAIGMVGQQEGEVLGLLSLMQIDPQSAFAKVYHLVVRSGLHRRIAAIWPAPVSTRCAAAIQLDH